MAELSITSLGKSFGDVRALDSVTIVAEEGKLLTLLGPSGCGKSTTLWSVAGLHTPDTGTISIGDRVVYDAERRVEVPPEDRQCGVVFQSYAIWPHMSVADNVGYPLKLRKVAKAERRNRIEEVLALVELDHLGGRYPHELSGGQQQRVALARSLAYQPRLLLLDEPFSNLDAKLRERARDWLRDLQQRVGITTVFVTHDQDEALSMSDRVVVMNAGRVAQIGTPEEVYGDPADGFVADFVGSINLVPGEIVRVDGDDADFVVEGTSDPVRVRVDGGARVGPGRLGVRPEAIAIVGEGDADRLGTVRGIALEHRFLGDHYRQTIGVGNARVSVQTPLASIPEHPVLRFPDVCKVFPASTDQQPRPSVPTPQETP
ncbi:MAG: ABC transporter ATP-binding protein [Ilumatobacter sp.]|nr:ABC transporter ATP-binding protein [Ilumatobacter sp.]